MSKDLYIDISHMAYRFLFTNTQNIKEIGCNYLRHLLLKNGLFHFINRFKPDRCFVCFDTKASNWRYKVLPTYKGQRKANRDKHDIDWQEFFSFLDTFQEDLLNHFPIYSLKMDSLEADDIIAHLVRKNKDVNKIIITSDGDYTQLLKYPNTKVYDPMKDKFVVCEQPRLFLEQKILTGDKSDNIPAIRPRCGIKTAEKLIDSGEIEKLLSELDPDGGPCEIKRNYDRNKTLIDLDCTPPDLLDELDDLIDSYTLGSTKNLFNYLKKYQLRDLLDEISYVRQVLETLQ